MGAYVLCPALGFEFCYVATCFFPKQLRLVFASLKSKAGALRGLYRIHISMEYWTAGATLSLASLFQTPFDFYHSYKELPSLPRFTTEDFAPTYATLYCFSGDITYTNMDIDMLQFIPFFFWIV